MRNKIWEYRSEKLNKENVRSFSESMNLPPAVAVILLNRGINTEKAAGAYFKKSLENIHDPFMLDGMEDACDRILKAICEKEKITVFGDYDVDGITSTAVLYKFLTEAGANAEYYIPDRITEGYGVNVMAVNKLARGGTKLMITVDCGITAVGEVEFAKTQGMEVIITDHHTCKEELPRAVAVINPKRKDSSYPFDALAGVGVAFKLVLALAVRLGMSTKDVFFKFIDMVALGTIADVVPLVDENRVIADKGISAIQNTANNGIKAMLSVCSAEGKALDSTSVAFMLAPRINAAGRLENARIAVELLTEGDYSKAEETAEFLNETNRRRQAIEQKIFEEALAQIEAFEEEQYVYVLSCEGWHHGVIGIVASRICEKFYRPCILISCENGKGKGSGRSIEEINLFDALADSEEILTQYGGHAQAAGLSLPQDKIDEFRKRINAYAKSRLENSQPMPKISIDCRLQPSDVTMRAAKMIARLAPFGQGNEDPVFALCGVKILSMKRIGADGRHLRLRVSGGGYSFSAVGFGMGDMCEEFSEGDTADIAFTMNINEYQGTESLQLLLKDLKK